VAEVSKITESARGEMCTIRLPGVCNHDPATTVWCHANGSAAGKGMWMKSNDLLGAYGCSACHDVYDRRRRPPAGTSREYVELCFWEGHARSLVILTEVKQIIVLKRGALEVTA
jgi:hypothetical protein